MILFTEDWSKHPSAIIDLETSNKSFIRLAGLYKSMGIRNHTFLLALHNPLLQGVDPFSNDLTKEQMYMIAKEVKENPWYYFREVMRVPADGSPHPVPLRANRANIALYWLFFNHITVMLLQPRQTGKSLSTDGLSIYINKLAGINYTTYLLTRNEELRVKNIARLKNLSEGLPFYLNLKSKKDTNNTTTITCSRLGNRYITGVGQSSVEAARKIARGETIPMFHIDELAFISNIDVTLPSALAASSAAREIASAYGTFYGNIFTTTAGYLSTKSGRFAYKIYNGSFKWSERVFDCLNEEDLKEFIRRNSPGGKAQVVCDFNHRQLGFTDEWLRERIETAMTDGEDAGADYLNIWAQGSETSPISKEILARLNQSRMYDPITTISKYGYATRWYVDSNEIETKCANRTLVMGLDTSEAIGNDDISMCTLDASTGETICTGVFNETNVIIFSQWLADFLIEFPNITLVIEKRSTGTAIIDNLILLLEAKGIDPFKRIFNWVVNDADTNPDYYNNIIKVGLNFRDPNVVAKYRKHFGYATSAAGRASRDNLYGASFSSATKYLCDVARDLTLIMQLTSLVTRNGRIDHPQGEHDDMCFIGDMLVRTINGNIPIKNLKLGDLVLTREGYKPIIAIYKRKEKVITKYGITGTPDHPFITPNGIVKFKDIEDDTEVYIWKEKLLSTTAKNITDILTQKEDNAGYPEEENIVYNLTIADCHEYFVNDVLVHNCISWLLAHWFLTNAKNLPFYGINPRTVLSSLNNKDENGNEITEEDKAKQIEQQQYKKQVDELVTLMRNETNYYKISNYINRIKHIYSYIEDDTYKNSFNLDSVIEDIKFKRSARSTLLADY